MLTKWLLSQTYDCDDCINGSQANVSLVSCEGVDGQLTCPMYMSGQRGTGFK